MALIALSLRELRPGGLATFSDVREGQLVAMASMRSSVTFQQPLTLRHVSFGHFQAMAAKDMSVRRLQCAALSDVSAAQFVAMAQ